MTTPLTQTSKNHATIFACSPRPGGNSDRVAELFTKGLAASGGNSQTLYLRGHRVEPCQDCGHCRRTPGGRCILRDKDESAPLFAALQSAPVLFFASPIYFYHLPAQFKALVDRAQSYYLRKLNKDPGLEDLARRKAFIALVAGRSKGEKLFEGALLTLKYFLRPFNVTLAEPLLLRGLDQADDLRNNSGAEQQVLDYVQEAVADGSSDPG